MTLTKQSCRIFHFDVVGVEMTSTYRPTPELQFCWLKLGLDWDCHFWDGFALGGHSDFLNSYKLLTALITITNCRQHWQLLQAVANFDSCYKLLQALTAVTSCRPFTVVTSCRQLWQLSQAVDSFDSWHKLSSVNSWYKLLTAFTALNKLK